MHGEMACRVCGWWPPVVRVHKGKTAPASDAWRWRQLLLHVEDAMGAEFADGRQDGPHTAIANTVELIDEESTL